MWVAAHVPTSQKGKARLYRAKVTYSAYFRNLWVRPGVRTEQKQLVAQPGWGLNKNLLAQDEYVVEATPTLFQRPCPGICDFTPCEDGPSDHMDGICIIFLQKECTKPSSFIIHNLDL